MLPSRHPATAKRSSRSQAACVAALAGLLLAVGPTLALGVDAEPAPPETFGGEALVRAYQEQVAKQERFERWLQSPEARDERQRSQTAYAELGDERARELLLDEFKDIVENSGQLPLESGEVARYLGDHTAVLATSEGEDAQPPLPGEPASEPSSEEQRGPTELIPQGEAEALIETSVPLRAEDDSGAMAPLDLSLEQVDDRLEPANALVGASFPERLAEGIELGDGGAIGLRLAGAEPEAKAARLGDSALLYPNARGGRDLLVSAEARGIKLSTVIRSPQAAAAAERFRLTLPEGALLRGQPDGSAVIVRDEELLARIAFPIAEDAQGQPVPARMRVDGDELVLSLDAAGGDYAYPILLDPYVETYATGAFGATTWPPFEPAGGPFHVCPSSDLNPDPFCAWFGGNLAISAPHDEGSYPALASGEKRWTLPNGTSSPDATTAWVESAAFGSAYFAGNAAQPAQPFFYAGIWNTRTNGFSDVFVRLGNQSFSPTTVSIPRTAGVPGAGDDGQQVRFGLADYTGTTTTHTGAALAQASSATIALEDPEPPSQTITNDGQLGAWKKDGNLTFDLASSDPGLGVLLQRFWWPTTAADSSSYELEGQPSLYRMEDKAGKVPGSGSPGTDCTGARTAPCPQSISQSFSVAVGPLVSEGRHEVYIHTFDPLIWGHAAFATRQVRIDRSPPEIELSGSLAEAPEGKLDARTYQLTVKATDGSTESPDQERSGLKDLKLYLDGNLIPAPAQISAQSCPASSCEGEVSYTLDASALSSGAHTLRIEATDQLGQVRKKHLDLSVDGLAGVILTPKRGDTTARQFGLLAERQDPSMTHVEFQYRRPGVSGFTWTPVPIAQLTVDYSGNHPIDTWLPLESSGKSPAVTWDVPPTPGIAGADGAINLRARFKGAGGPPAIAGDSPALWWRLGESEDEPAAADSSGEDRPGVYSGRSETAPMAIDDGALSGAADDGAVRLNGTGQHIRSSYAPYASGSERLFMGWARRDTATSKDVLIGGQDPALGIETPALTLGNGGDLPSSTIRWAPRGGSAFVADWANAAPAAGQWFHWALAYDASSGVAELFIDNASRGTRSIGSWLGAYQLPDSTFTVGATYSGATAIDPFHGALDEVAIETGPFTAPDTLAARVAAHYWGLDRGSSPVVPVTLDRDTTTSKHASAPVGPGSVDLLTGNFSVTADDVKVASYGSDLTVSRTYNSRKPELSFYQPFGPGWTASLPVDAAGSDYVGLEETGPVGDQPASVKITTSDTTEILFSRRGKGYEVEPMFSGLKLERNASNPSSVEYVLTDLEGNRTAFVKPGNDQAYSPVRITQTGQATRTTTRFGYEQAHPDLPSRVAWALAPTPAGVSCTTGSGPNATLIQPLPRGCRALTFTYSDTLPPSPPSPGPCLWKLHKISFHAWDPELPTPAMRAVDVARFDYQACQLHSAWDPRISPALKTIYGYDANFRLTSVTPPGENPWTIEYEGSPPAHDPNQGRLWRVKRQDPAVGSDAITTVDYEVPLSGSGAPYDMSPGDVAEWGQADIPTDATAILQPNPSTGASETDLNKASVRYMNRNGDLVNHASPGGAISTTEYGPHRGVVSELTSGNRVRALASADPAAAADVLETDRIYNADGTEVHDEFGPMHEVRLANGSSAHARAHTVTSYDEGHPTGKDYHLPTKQVAGARICSPTPLDCSMAPGSAGDVETRTTTTEYQWALRQPTAVKVDPNGLNLISTTAYDAATGLPTQTRHPKANGSGTDAHTRNTIYWTAGPNSADSACSNRPEFANLPCKTVPGGQPSGPAPDLPVSSYEYNLWQQTTKTTEDAPGSTPDRITAVGYDAAGRPTTSAISGGEGQDVPTVTATYSSSTGRPLATSSSAGTITSGYDALGRLTSYMDADNVTSITDYDALGRPTMIDDAKAEQNYVYDTAGRLAVMVDDHAGAFTATHNADGQLLEEELPNGLTLTNSYDSTGNAIERAYSNGSSEVMRFEEASSVHGQVTRSSTFVAGVDTEVDLEFYDAAGRLTQSRTTKSAGCTVQSYAYDDNSNRTGMRVSGPLPSCDTSTGPATSTHSYDEADRLIDSGYAYDAFGRTTTVPGADAGGSGLTAGYYKDDRVYTLTQGGVTKTFTNDPLGRIRQTAATGRTTEISHYASGSDSPSWTEKGSDWIRAIADISADMSALQQGSGSTAGTLSWQLTNLHGDVVGETDSLGQLTGVFDSDAFGVPDGTVPSSGYGWLGAKQRRTQLSSGVMTMGQRVYLPHIGRFLQTDPVTGGSATAYDYVNQDPRGQLDLSGTAACKAKNSRVRLWKGQVRGTVRQTCSGEIYSQTVIACIQEKVKGEWRNVVGPHACEGNAILGPGTLKAKAKSGVCRSLPADPALPGDPTDKWRWYRVGIITGATGFNKPPTERVRYARPRKLPVHCPVVD